ncbi:MAG: WD40 repeat domain-containing protein, partial [Pseudomonadota bacterium]
RDAIATVAAPIHGMPKDELEGEDIRQFRLARRLRRAAISGLAILTVIAVAAGIFAWIQRDEAIVQRDNSEARRLATVAISNAAEQTDVAMLLALESLNTTKTNEGWEALFAALSRPVLARSPQTGHRAGVNRVAFSPDGKLMVSMGGDGVVGLWDATDPAAMRQIRKLEGHAEGDNIWEGAFSPDGQLLATPGGDWTVRLWDVATGEPLGEPLEGHEGAVWDVAFSPDEKLLVTAGSDSTVRLWDLERREHQIMATMGTLEDGTSNEVWEVTFSADGSRLLWVSSDGSLSARLVAGGSEVELLLAGHTEWRGGSVPGAAFSHDGTKLAVGSRDWTVQLWDLTPDEPTMRSLAGHDGFVVDLAFSRDDTLIASASQDRTVRIWDVETGKQSGSTLTGHTAEVFSVGFDPHGTLLASGSADQSVRLWDLHAGGSVGRRLDHGELVLGVSLSPDGSLAASAGTDSKISLWDVANGQRLFDIPGSHSGKQVRSVVFSPDMQLLASAGFDNAVRLWKVNTGLPASDPLVHTDRVCSAEFSPDGKLLATGTHVGTVQLWHPVSGAPLGPPLKGHSDAVCELAFSVDGTMLASAGSDSTVRLWNVGTGKQLGAELAGHKGWVLGLRFEPGGKHLLSVDSDGVVLRRDLLTRDSQVVLDRTNAGAASGWTAAAFSADGSVVAVATPDASVRLWDLASGRPAGVAFHGHVKAVENLDFGRNGFLVASASEDGDVRVWPVQSLWPELACQAAGRELSSTEWKRLVDVERDYRRQCNQRQP